MLEEIKGIGPKLRGELSRININTIEDLLTYYPYRYNYYKAQKIEEIQDGEHATITGVIENIPKVNYIKRNLNRLGFTLNTGTELLSIIIFNRAFMKPHLKIGKTITVIGKYNKKSNTITASDLKLKPIINEEMEPVYHLINSIKKTIFKNAITSALEKNIYLPSYVPEYLSKEYNFIDKISAIKEIHKPESTSKTKEAKLFLIYEELFSFMLKINYLKIKNKSKETYDLKQIEEKEIRDFISSLPFSLTEDQINSIEDIKTDFISNKRMNRLLLGDVGSGKTIVALVALYTNYLAGYQGILMAPTEILASQHFDNAIKIFKNNNLKIALLSSSTKKSDKEKIKEGIKNNSINILIGTHSVLNDEIEPPKLGLVITDEQHRFGVKQRQLLQQKGKEVDVLYMSATPIPRTLALTIYGDMDISQIKTKPMNNKPVITKYINETEIKNVLSSTLEELKKGHQIYVIVPLVEENEDLDMENVQSIYNKMDSAFNKKIPMAIIHGKLKSKEKEQIMNDFQQNKIKILISTTVIEVGIDVKNATTMIIFNAERFGLATLHQLRGRVGRSDIQSYCYVISNYESERLKILEESNDGFYISEKDFQLRGTGDLFGLKQSGDMNFKIANLKNDFKILQKCKDDSDIFLKENLHQIEKFPNQKKVLDSIIFID